MSLLPESAGDFWAMLGVAVAFPPTFLAVRDAVSMRGARQELLSEVPRFERRGWDELERAHASEEERSNFLLNTGFALSDVEATLQSPRRYIYRALRRLIRDGKIEICVVRGVADGSHPQIPAGPKIVIPLAFRGGVVPSLRATAEEHAMIFESLK